MNKIFKYILAFCLCVTSMFVSSTSIEAVDTNRRLKRLDRTNWKIAVFRTEQPDKIEEHGDSTNAFNSTAYGTSEGPAERMIDGDYNTHWHDEYNDQQKSSKYSIIIQLPKSENIAGFEALRRNNGGNGKLDTYKVYTLNDENLLFSSTNKDWSNQSWGEPVDTGNFTEGTVAAKFNNTITATHVRIDVTGVSDSVFGSLAELNLYTVDERTPLSFENMTFDYDSTKEFERNGGNDLKTIFSDGDPYTFFTTKYGDGINGNAYFTIDLGKYYDLTGIDYTKRYHNDGNNKWNCTGNLIDYKIEVSIDGTTWTEVKTGKTNKLVDYKVNNAYKSFLFEGDTGSTIEGTTNIEFAPVCAKYIKITSTSSFHWNNEGNKYFTIADLNLYGNEETKGYNVAATSTNQNISSNISLKYTDGSKMTGTSDDKYPTSLFNGNRNSSDYFDFGQNKKSGYLEIDLGSYYDVNSINALFWFGNGNERRYKDVVILVSENRNFTEYDVVYNDDDSGKHGFGEATATDTGNETSAGRTIEFDTRKARFVRVYMAGSTAGNGNQIVEFEVYGVPSETADFVKYTDTADLTSKEWLFESYYEDNTGATAVKPNEETKVAKYITPDVLTVKAQTEIVEGKANVRFISSVASGNLEKVRFKIEIINENNSVTKMNNIYTTKAYGEIIADGVQITSASNVFDNSASTYFVACKLNNIPSSAASSKVRVTPYWLPNGYADAEENYVEGVSRTFTVQEFFDNASQIINEGE